MQKRSGVKLPKDCFDGGEALEVDKAWVSQSSVNANQKGKQFWSYAISFKK